MGLLVATGDYRDCSTRTGWRRGCDWDPTVSEFVARILLLRVRLESDRRAEKTAECAPCFTARHPLRGARPGLQLLTGVPEPACGLRRESGCGRIVAAPGRRNGQKFVQPGIFPPPRASSKLGTKGCLRGSWSSPLSAPPRQSILALRARAGDASAQTTIRRASGTSIRARRTPGRVATD
jgi:hypothetical protein